MKIVYLLSIFFFSQFFYINRLFSIEKNNTYIQNKLKIDLNLRPHNLKHEVYYELTKEYEEIMK